MATQYREIGPGDKIVFDDITGVALAIRLRGQVADKPLALTTAQAAALAALLLDPPASRFSDAVPATAVGTYLATGSAQTITVGFVPTLFMVKDVSGATPLVYVVNGANWNGRSATLTASLTIDNGLTLNSDGTVTVGTNAFINTAAANYEWFAFGDNGRECLITRDHAGNDQATRKLLYAAGFKLKAALWKRDSTVLPLLALRGKSSRLVDGTASATTTTINADGTIDIVGNSNEINIWSASSGESVAMLGFRDGAEGVYVTTYTGNGGTNNLQTPFDELEAFLVFPRGTTSKPAAFWTSRLSATVMLSVGAESAATVGSGCITSQSRGRAVLGSDTRVNGSGTEYCLIAFRKQRIAPGQPISARIPRRMRSTAHFVLPTGTYFNAGTSDSLKINGPLTLEWWGCHYNSNTSGLSVSATINNTTTQQQALMWRSDGADATQGAVSYGIALINPISPGGDGSPIIAVPVSGFFDLPQTTTTSVDDNAPWMTGIQVPNRMMQHIVATHLGGGFWNIYINGRLAKERNRDMSLASTPRPNIQSGSGHTLCFGARKRGSTPELANFFYAIYGARIYSRGLSADEVSANWSSLYDDNGAVATPGFTEEWLASNATSAATLPATVLAANNATVVGSGAVLSGF